MAASYNTYYFDGVNFSSATALYTDAALTSLAPDGFYSQNGIIRQQSNGILLNAQPCAACQTPCGSGVSASISNQPGYFNADIDVASDLGAVVMYFYMGGIIPDGVLATFNNIEYNRLTSYKNQDTVTLVDGSGSTVVYAGINNQQTGEPTYVGRQNNALVGPTRNNINEYNLVSGTYIATGNTRSITVVNNQAGFAALNVSNPVSPVFTMVVPKNLATKSLVNLQIFAPMNNTAFHWEVLCPEDLP